MPATSNYFDEKHCIPSLTGETKDEVITELIQCFVASGAINEDESIDLGVEVLARENEGTTGIGKGVAMPHARNSGVVDGALIAVGVHETGVDFDALDGAPVNVVFLIAASDPQEYLRVAGRVAKIGRDDIEMRALPRQGTAERMASFLEQAWGSNA